MNHHYRSAFTGFRVAFLSAVAGVCMAFGATVPQSVRLDEGWSIQASAKVKEKGEAISGSAFAPAGWYPATVPTTVLGALVDDGVYKDIYFAKNLASIPEDQFKASWWYRREFDVADTTTYAVARLLFEGINYSANIFVNGKKIAGSDKLAGTFRRFGVDVTSALHKGKNVLAVEIFPPKPGDYSMGFVDWNPLPPDREMGLFRPVSLVLSGPVTVEYPYVNSQIDTKTLATAKLTASAILTNQTGKAVTGILKANVGGIAVEQPYSLKAKESKSVSFTPDKFPQLVVKNPKLWWPVGMGEPTLNTLQMVASGKTEVSDSQSVLYGIRQTEDYINAQGHRGYMVNGRKVLIRGGGWQDELLLRERTKNLDAQMRYTLHMNLNTIRLEGIWGSSSQIFDMADKYGILLMPGWSCQWEWNDYIGKKIEDAKDSAHGSARSKADMKLVKGYFHDQLLWLRHHPSIVSFGVGSDRLPVPEMEKFYRAEVAEYDTGLPLLTSAASFTSSISGPSAVKMNGPYDYVTPHYWYVDTALGGAFGFNTETGPGPQVPVLESLKKMIPADSLWPINDIWLFHAGRREFATLDRYLLAFNNRYGAAKDADDFAFRSQAASYEAMRPMFESFIANRPVTTGLIQWMHNASWPKFFWQFYDYYLMPTGAFYGARKGNQPLNLIYNYGTQSVYLVNQTMNAQAGMQATVALYDVNSKLVLTKTAKADVASDGSVKVFDVPPPAGITPAYFLSLTLADAQGHKVSDNFYWLSVKKDVLDYTKGTWFITPNKEWSDLTALNKLPPATLAVEKNIVAKGADQEVTVTLKNPGKDIAFFVELSVRGDKSGRTVTPVFWDDNYVSILPGESKTFHATVATEDLAGEKPVFSYRGWNVKGN